MNETLMLRLGPTPDHSVRWAFMTEVGVTLADEAENVAALSAIANLSARARLVVAVVPGEQAAMRSLLAPPKNQAQLRAAAGFLLEDELAESLDHMHVAVSRHENGAGIAIAIKKPVIESWLEALASAGVSPDVMTADYALLPIAETRGTFIVFQDRVFGAIGLDGFAIDRPLADEIAPSLILDKQITDLVVYGALRDRLTAGDAIAVDQQAALDDETIFGLQLREAARAPNLLRGAYRKRRDWRSAAGPWRRTAILAAACCGALLMANIAAAIRDARTADQLREETLALHQAAFPEAPNEDPRNYARQVLAAGGSAPKFLSLTNAVAESVDSANAVQIDRIRYNAARGEYAVNLRFSDIADFEALKTLLETRGIVATETGGVRRTGAVYIGELRISTS